MIIKAHLLKYKQRDVACNPILPIYLL